MRKETFLPLYLRHLETMSMLAAPAAPPPSGGLIDPTKQAEYPILLGDKLAGKESAKQTRFVNITYNHKSKSATPQQRATITRTSTSRDIYDLTIKDRAANAEQTSLTYTYRGSVDPSMPVSESEPRNLVLVFDPQRKAFILEPVSTRLNFNLRSAPGKTDKQVAEQYPQLNILPEDDQASGDDRQQDGASEDEGPADDENPYDYRHFLPKADGEAEKVGTSASTTPDPHQIVSKTSTPSLPPTTNPKPKAVPQAKPQTNPLRQQKRAPKATNKANHTASAAQKPKSAARVDPEDLASDSSPSDAEEPARAVSSSKPAPSLGSNSNSNIIIDGDLIIDMGSPPPSRPVFKVNPAHFPSNNASANEADDDEEEEEEEEEEIEDLRLPSPARPTGSGGDSQMDDAQMAQEYEEEPEDDDELAAEMEAALEESAREEEQARNQQLSHQQFTVESEDESEVSEEE